MAFGTSDNSSRPLSVPFQHLSLSGTPGPGLKLQLTPPVDASGKRYDSMGSFIPLLHSYAQIHLDMHAAWVRKNIDR